MTEHSRMRLADKFCLFDTVHTVYQRAHAELNNRINNSINQAGANKVGAFVKSWLAAMTEIMFIDLAVRLNQVSLKLEPCSEPFLQSDNKEQLIQLAAQIAVEKDPKKFHALVIELNDLLQASENRLDEQVDDHSQSQHPDKR